MSATKFDQVSNGTARAVSEIYGLSKPFGKKEGELTDRKLDWTLGQIVDQSL
jgi:hypothetical protein